MSLSGLKRTPLYEVYKDCSRLVDFAGWELPVYFEGIKEEHLAVRERAGIFDTSHMGEIRVIGPDALKFIQRVFCNDLNKIPNGKAQYGAFLNFEAGIIDDVIVYRISEQELFICVNAANAEKDFQWLKDEKSMAQVELINQSQEYAQIAVQGPKAVQVFSRLFPQAEKILRFGFVQAELLGQKCIIGRTGYTGEDGVEIFCPAQKAVDIWSALLDTGKDVGIQPCGLGARDTLRLEMGYPLHGHDISEQTTPLEADLGWIIGWGKEFIGKDVLEKQRVLGVRKKRIGLKMIDKGVARDGYPLKANGKLIGKVTSGTKTPCLPYAIAMGYVETEFAEPGRELAVEIRGEDKKAQVVKLPFLK